MYIRGVKVLWREHNPPFFNPAIVEKLFHLVSDFYTGT